MNFAYINIEYPAQNPTQCSKTYWTQGGWL